MTSAESFFADYAADHRTSGNKMFHRAGIPLIILSLLGLLARIELIHSPGLRLDAALALLLSAEFFYLLLEWRLGLVMGVALVGLYFAGRPLVVWLLWSMFGLGWIFQFVGHVVYEKEQPAFLRNLTHLLIGPLWIMNDVVPIVQPRPSSADAGVAGS